MYKIRFIFFFLIGLWLAPLQVYGQEEPQQIDFEKSAEVFLEAYSDDFQENFFEALKQKGIENYDRAINLLLRCKRLDTGNHVVDHELARAYLKQRQYPQAEAYALTALTSEPENFWYTDTLVDILKRQGKSIESLKNELPYGYPKFNENLALVYFKKKEYETALNILRKAGQSSFTQALSSKINDSIEKQQSKAANSSRMPKNTSAIEANPIEGYKTRIQDLLRSNDISQLRQLAEEALESYPAQPFFYYAQGYALNKGAEHQDAIETLETGLDYLVGDVSLANKMYQELADAYNSLNDSVKANMYLRKIKPGF